MKPTLVIPFWGDHPAYRGWLEEWVRRYEALGLDTPVVIVSDEALADDLVPQIERVWVDTDPFADLIDPRYPYDRKGAIVCATINALWQYPLFVLDADAFLVGDPSPHLGGFAAEEIAMPADEGAFGKPYAGTYDGIVRRCAGVIWYGGHYVPHSRHLLTRHYRQHFLALRAEMEAGSFPEERRLLEQHAWTMVAHQWESPVLPRELNWPACFKHAGANPHAAIHHHIGRRKWAGQAAAPTPGLLNDGQLAALSGEGKPR
jgi:hypothetical protein